MGGRSAECPGPHGDQVCGWYSELNGRGPESAVGCVGVQEFTNVWRGEVVEGLEGEEQNLEMDAGFDREPVKLLKDRSSGATVHGFPVIRTDQPSRFGTQVIRGSAD